MKRFLFLGASWGQITPLTYFKNSSNIEIYTLDNNTKNPGHLIAKESFDISTNNLSEIRKIVKKIGVDAIFCFASDVGQLSQSILSREIGQHYNPVKSIEVLTDKFKFRNLLKDAGIQNSFYMKLSKEDVKDKKILSKLLSNLPLVIKPLQGSGSKGVNFIFKDEDLHLIHDSLKYSNSGLLIAEQYLAKEGKQICGDGFFEDSKLVDFSTGDGYFYEDSSKRVPYAESFPSSHSKAILDNAKRIIESILNAAGYIKGPINFDILVSDKTPFVIEVAPRSGGNYIPDVIKKHNGVDLLRANLNTFSDKAYSFNEKRKKMQYISSFMIHSKEDGRFKSLKIEDDLIPFIYDKILYVNKGDIVQNFTQGSHAIGNLKLKFPNHEKQKEIMSHITNSIQVRLD